MWVKQSETTHRWEGSLLHVTSRNTDFPDKMAGLLYWHRATDQMISDLCHVAPNDLSLASRPLDAEEFGIKGRPTVYPGIEMR